jgi:antitoxin component HigA of HigAB toxin-antitoxin module
MSARNSTGFGVVERAAAETAALRRLQNDFGNTHGMSAADLSRILGTSRNLGAMILRGERQLTLAHVRTLAKHFCVSADLFLP